MPVINILFHDIEWDLKNNKGEAFEGEMLSTDIEHIMYSIEQGYSEGELNTRCLINNKLIEYTGYWKIIKPLLFPDKAVDYWGTTSSDISTKEGKIAFIKNWFQTHQDKILKLVEKMPEEWDGFELRWLIDGITSEDLKYERTAKKKSSVYKRRYKEFVYYCLKKLNI